MILQDFDRIAIINLKHRRDRRSQMIKELKRVGLYDDPRVSFFEAIKPKGPANFGSVGFHGSFLSHLAILNQAALENASVLILEDDCDLDIRLQHYHTDESWDMFYGGYYASDETNLGASDIIGAHMMGFTSRAAKRVCEYFSQLQVDGQHAPIDGAYVWFRRANPDIRAHFAVPPLGFQRASRSDVTPRRFFDKVPVLRSVAETARRVRRRLRGRRPLNPKFAKF